MKSSTRSYLDQIREKVKVVSAAQLETWIQSDSLVVIDVREQEELLQGIIPRSIHISRGFLELDIEEHVKDKDHRIVVYCAAGLRSALAADTLNTLGYSNVFSLEGGIAQWINQGKKTETPTTLSPQDRIRYQRHIIIPEIGETGQLKLLNSKVLIIGAGGLGCPTALYLGAAGVGTIGIVDFDKVEESNLHRQILHTPARIGTYKTESAKTALIEYNPNLNVICHTERLSVENAESLIRNYDLVIDGSDNFQTRYLINDISVQLGVPVVHGSVFRFEGQVSLFDPTAPNSPCYRCLYPAPPPAHLAPTCKDAGVLGILPGIIGLFQANEAIKRILQIGSPLSGRLLQFDALDSKVQEFRIKKNPNCNCCVQKNFESNTKDLSQGNCRI